MVRGILSCAAGLLALAAFSLPALADASPISFVSGPLAGAVAQDAKHEEEALEVAGGRRFSDEAFFQSGDYVGWVDWSRLNLRYRWRDTGQMDDLTDMVKRAFKASGVEGITGGQDGLGGFISQYRTFRLTGARPMNCGVFGLHRRNDWISGFACTQGQGPIPLRAVIEGLAVKDVLEP
ncbi:hypothetical protein [Inquilinus sp.]|jgi:hypothetical protein|uniref:hypothetical protein n=1 Tax=Inquilinus sp. TaxID=1932117 RepID=UPI003784705D